MPNLGSLWKKVSGALQPAESGVGIDVPSVTTDGLDYNSLTPDYRNNIFTASHESSNQSTTSTSYTTIINFDGEVIPGEIPTNATIYARLIARIKNDTSNETTTVRARIYDDSAGTYRNLDATEVSRTSTSFVLVDSGWVDVSSSVTNPDNLHRDISIQMKVSGGTGSITNQNNYLGFVGVESTA